MRNRKGSMILMVMILVVVGGILATQLTPAAGVIEERQGEVQLKHNLAEIRQALDMQYLATEDASGSFSYEPPRIGGTTAGPIDVEAVLSQLIAGRHDTAAHTASEPGGFLTNTMAPSSLGRRDPNVRPHRWGSSGDKEFWRAVENHVDNNSFEANFRGWVSSGVVTTDGVFFMRSDRIDDYPGQNRLGIPFSKTGQSIRIVK